MPILRRYVRVSKYTVLEARIFLPNPADVPWFTRTDAMERVFAEIKHLVLPMLTEARNVRGGGGSSARKARGTEVVNGEDFEASLYLTGSGSLHAVLRKDRSVQIKQPIRSNSTVLLDAASESSSPVIVREESESPPDIQEIPEATPPLQGWDQTEAPLFLPAAGDDYAESDDEFVPFPATPDAKNKARKENGPEAADEDKKKLKFRTDYEGFTIYEKVLCIVVTRKEKKKGKAASGSQEKAGLIEGWIVMSQAVRDGEDGDEDKDGEE
ncbi:hypothetical protein FN846DRAFT_902601 [Sphaerosporella brunnea]|uniref:Uncharacterized protein n=1 Tax=Sphaerosporella brunnea TaxID=1250544 RepID=A0A5J5F9K1_9PEZI|nr:hypothetical protein FN846DRAFT_902601 [Sphaerosporella brunnea]